VMVVVEDSMVVVVVPLPDVVVVFLVVVVVFVMVMRVPIFGFRIDFCVGGVMSQDSTT
jgi:hypothetical protein